LPTPFNAAQKKCNDLTDALSPPLTPIQMIFAHSARRLPRRRVDADDRPD
jgi:hypothetical protein